MADGNQQGMTLLILESNLRVEALLTRLVESQENSEQQQIEILRTIRNNCTAQGTGNAVQQEEIREAQPRVNVDGPRATYYPDGRNKELFDSILASNWGTARRLLNGRPAALMEALNEELHTPLHATIYNRCVKRRIMREIVSLTPLEGLNYETDEGYTALHLAAIDGDKEAAELIVNRNPDLTQIGDSTYRQLPIEVGLEHVTLGQKETVRYLYRETLAVNASPFLGQDGARILSKAIEANFYDIASSLVQRSPELITKPREDGVCALELIVQRPFAFYGGAQLKWWQKCIYPLIHLEESSVSIERIEQERTQSDEENLSNTILEFTKVKKCLEVSSTGYKRILMFFLKRGPGIKKLSKKKLMHKQANDLLTHLLLKDNPAQEFGIRGMLMENPKVMKVAIKHGIVEFVEEFLKKFRDQAVMPISGERMMDIAIAERNEQIVNLICKAYDHFEYKMGSLSKVDYNGNTILHHVAKLAPPAQLNLISGAVFQMQRELQWFKGVEGMISETDRFKRNNEGVTAQFIFTEQHKDLLNTGAEWIKATSGSCMVVAALIATVSFAAAFTIPGGNISDSKDTKFGTPIFLGKPSFIVFAVSDALALLSSITSVLMFLAIYTSRYAEMDFLKSLPQKLIFGLATLFMSLVALLVAFGASLYIVVGSRFAIAQALTTIVVLSCVPLGLFAWLQLPLFGSMIRSTYWGSLFQKHRYVDI